MADKLDNTGSVAFLNATRNVMAVVEQQRRLRLGLGYLKKPTRARSWGEESRKQKIGEGAGLGYERSGIIDPGG